MPDPYRITRRGMLTGAVVAAASMPALQAVGNALSGALELTGDPRRAALTLSGHELWVVDTRRFEGRPVLTLEETGAELRMALTGARYPGTGLPADFIAVVEKASRRLRLQLAIARAAAEVPAVAWLAGLMPAAVVTRPGLQVLNQGRDGVLDLPEPAAAEFRPDWSLTLAGGVLSLYEEQLAAERITVAMPAPEAPSLMERPSPLRSLVTLERGRNRWPLWEIDGLSAIGSLRSEASPFDRLTFEVGGKQTAVSAEPLDPAPRLFFAPGGPTKGLDGKPFAIGLTGARFARYTGSGETETALTAEFDPTPAWAVKGGLRMQVAGTPDSPPFVLRARGESPVQVECTPTLVALEAPMPDAIVEQTLVRPGTRVALADSSGPVTSLTAAPIELTVIRPSDLLVLKFILKDITLRDGYLTTDAGAPGTLIVEFPGQHIAEETFPSGLTGLFAHTTPPIRSRIAGPSRLAFVIPAGVSMAYSLAALLRCTGLTPPVDPEAAPPTPRLKADYASDYTAIEAPYRLWLSPDANGVWEHAVNPVSQGMWTELWHTRLVDRTGGIPLVQAIAADAAPDPFNMLPNYRNRPSIVNASAVAPIPAHTLMLSALGAWADLHGSWAEGALETYIHRMMMGRDQYVRVVERGYLLPYGHKASMVSIVEREMRGGIARLYQRTWLVIREPERAFTANDMPFRAVRIVEPVTPLLSNPVSGASGWTQVDGENFLFHIVTTDFAGERQEFTQPLYFVQHSAVESTADRSQIDPDRMASYYALYNADANLRTVNLGGQLITYTPLAPRAGAEEPEEGDPTYPTRSLLLRAALPKPNRAQLEAGGLAERVFGPVVEEAEVSLPQLDALQNTTGYRKVRYLDLYVAEGFDGYNVGQIYFELKNESRPTMLCMPLSLINPNLRITGLSRLWGPIGGIPLLTGLGKFIPSLLFGDLAKLLGFFDLPGMLNLVMRFLPWNKSLPSLPNLNWPDLERPHGKLDWPRLPSMHWDLNAPSADVDSPSFPGLKFPDIPSFDLPKVPLPDLGDFHMPALPDFPGVPDWVGSLIPKIGFKKSSEKKLAPGAEFPDEETRAAKGVRLYWQFSLPSFPASKPIFIARQKTETQEGTTMMIEVFYVKFSDDKKTKKTNSTSQKAASTPKNKTWGVMVQIKNFSINLGFVTAPIYLLEAGKDVGGRTVRLRFGNMGLDGPLTFIESVTSRFGGTYAKEPPPMGDEEWKEIDHTFKDIKMGSFVLSNLTPAIGIALPKEANFTLCGPVPEVKFRISVNKAENPFSVQAGRFSGGGFLQLTFSTSQFIGVSLGIEAGACWTIDCKVAKGALYLRATFAMAYVRQGNYISFTIGVRGGGQLKILGVLRVTAETWIGLTYEVKTKRCYGKAVMYFEVEFLFFSVGATVTVSVTFNSGSGTASAGRLAAGRRRPDRHELLARAQAYCAAFNRGSVAANSQGGGAA